MMSWFQRLFGDRLPERFPGELAKHEHALAYSPVTSGGHVVVTHLGLWLPDGVSSRRMGWHLISKATWSAGTLTITESQQIGVSGDAVLLRDREPAAYHLTQPGKVPLLVRQRVDGSIRSRHRQDLPAGGVWFVQRKIPGQDGVVMQARIDPGTDLELVAAIASKVTEKSATFED